MRTMNNVLRWLDVAACLGLGLLLFNQPALERSNRRRTGVGVISGGP
jgi:hypothetical protein